MIKDIKGILCDEELDELKHIFSTEEVESQRYKQAIKKLDYALQEEGEIDDAESDEIVKVFESESENSIIYKRADKRLNMCIQLQRIDLIRAWRKEIEAAKDMWKIIGIPPIEIIEKCEEFITHYQKLLGCNWYDWYNFVLDRDDLGEDYSKMVALYDMGKESKEWKDLVGILMEKIELSDEMEVVQAKNDCRSEIKSIVDAFSSEEYYAIYNLFMCVEDIENPYKVIYESILKVCLGHMVELENIFGELENGVQILYRNSKDCNEFFENFKKIINDIHAMFVKYLGDFIQNDKVDLNKDALREFEITILKMTNVEIWISLKALSCIENKELLKPEYLLEISHWTTDYKNGWKEISQIQYYPSLVEECEKFERYASNPNFQIISVDFVKLADRFESKVLKKTYEEKMISDDKQSKMIPDNNGNIYNDRKTIEPFSGVALAGMILGIMSIPWSCMFFMGLGLFPGLPGLVLSIVANRKNIRNKRMALAGLGTSIIGISLSLLTILIRLIPIYLEISGQI